MSTQRIGSLVTLSFSIAWFTAQPGWAQSRNYHVEIHNPAKFDTGEALKETPGQEVAAEHRPLLHLPATSVSNNRPDGAMQAAAGPVLNTTSGISFDGVGANGYAPPDTNMAVGPNHIVQWVNVRFAVYSKAGVMQAGYPKAGNAFWTGFGGPCETTNSGDPIIQYDALANRWVASQFAISGSTYMQCFAVSTSPDPSGTYNRYAYQFTTGFNDYPKITVWPSAYFGSYNIFASTFGGWVGPKICAYDRAAMLAGTSAVSECFSPGSSYGSLLPSDLDGGAAFAPPSPAGYFTDFGNNSLLLWKFTPDFANPNNASLSGPTNIAAASFSPACGGGTCIPQAGTSQLLDSLADRLMYRLAYRNFGDHESLVVNQSVTAGTSVGVRWYEIRSPGNAPFIFQQGTYAPDSTYRWMGSIAMDKVGNIGVGYSASSSSVSPNIRYTGRETGDVLGTLQTENIVSLPSTGSQTNGLSRWGDYSAMRIDPSDDCTFWYTTEYLKSSGSFNWSTRIFSFKFNSCGGTPSPDFSIAATPPSQSVVQGSSTSYTTTVTSLNGYSGNVNLSVTGEPIGAAPTFNPVSVTGSGSSTLSVTTDATTPAGTYTLTITGTDGSLTHTTTVTLVVTSVSPTDFAISATPASQTITGGTKPKYTVTITPKNGFTGVVSFSASGLPVRSNASFNPTTVNGSGTTTMTVNTNKNTGKGAFTITITGTSGGLVHTTTVGLTVN